MTFCNLNIQGRKDQERFLASPRRPYIIIEIQDKKRSLSLMNGQSIETKKCWAILDTGSDNTFIPQQFLFDIQATPKGGKLMTINSFSGTTERFINHYLISFNFIEPELQIRPKTYKVYEWLVERAGYAIIGRDLLNHFGIFFDGNGVINQSKLTLYWIDRGSQLEHCLRS